MKTIVRLYENFADAEGAMFGLAKLGLDDRQIGVLTSEPASGHFKQMNAKHVAGVGKLSANDYMLKLLNGTPVSNADALAGALSVFGLSKADGARYVDALRNGGTIEVVSISDDKAAEAAAIMNAKRAAASATTSETIPVIKEEMRVGKREVDAGGVRITTHVETRPIDRTVTLHEEHVTVEHHPVDRAAECTDDAFRDRSIEMTAKSERPVVTKRARMVEELRAYKDVDERVETIRDTLHHTEVSVAEKPAAGAGSFDAGPYAKRNENEQEKWS